MKPSHLVTPRTLADCTFTVDYSISQPRQHRISMNAVIVMIAIGVTTWILVRSLM